MYLYTYIHIHTHHVQRISCAFYSVYEQLYLSNLHVTQYEFILLSLRNAQQIHYY